MHCIFGRCTCERAHTLKTIKKMRERCAKKLYQRSSLTTLTVPVSFLLESNFSHFFMIQFKEQKILLAKLYTVREKKKGENDGVYRLFFISVLWRMSYILSWESALWYIPLHRCTENEIKHATTDEMRKFNTLVRSHGDSYPQKVLTPWSEIRPRFTRPVFSVFFPSSKRFHINKVKCFRRGWKMHYLEMKLVEKIIIIQNFRDLLSAYIVLDFFVYFISIVIQYLFSSQNFYNTEVQYFFLWKIGNFFDLPSPKEKKVIKNNIFQGLGNYAKFSSRREEVFHSLRHLYRHVLDFWPFFFFTFLWSGERVRSRNTLGYTKVLKKINSFLRVRYINEVFNNENVEILNSVFFYMYAFPLSYRELNCTRLWLSTV
jgi:hypothetical protein